MRLVMIIFVDSCTLFSHILSAENPNFIPQSEHEYRELIYTTVYYPNFQRRRVDQMNQSLVIY